MKKRSIPEGGPTVAVQVRIPRMWTHPAPAEGPYTSQPLVRAADAAGLTPSAYVREAVAQKLRADGYLSDGADTIGALSRELSCPPAEVLARVRRVLEAAATLKRERDQANMRESFARHELRRVKGGE